MSSDLVNALNILQGSCCYNQWIYSFLEPYLSGVVLDVGSGLGDIAALFISPEVQEVILSDCDHNFIEELQKRYFSLSKYRVVFLDVSENKVPTQLKEQRVDTVTCVNVLEHIQDDISALQGMRCMLKPAGRVLIFVPALPCIYGTLDSSHGHFRRYTQRTLKAKMQAAGFEVKVWRYMNIFGVLSWFLAGRLLKQRKFSEKACYQLDKIVPLLRWIEQGIRLPWGQSLLMVGQVVNQPKSQVD